MRRRKARVSFSIMLIASAASGGARLKNLVKSQIGSPVEIT
jgi:hypothetical protein